MVLSIKSWLLRLMAVTVLLLLLLQEISECQGALMFTSDNEVVLVDNPITVGNGSDVLIQVTCTDYAGVNGSWMFLNESAVPQSLTAFGISQDPMKGILRIYPSFLLEENKDLTSFICLANGTSQSVNFTLVDSLFFTEPLPSSLRMGDASTLNCSVPDIPSSTITFDNTTFNSSCSVWSDRGSFSRLVPIIPTQDIADPVFVVQPMNTTAILNQDAAFACIVSPIQTESYSLVNITWKFQPASMNTGSGSGGLDDTTTVIISEGVMDGFPYPGTSLLKIKSVNMTNEGDYFCTAQFTDGRNITSQSVTLQIPLDTSSNNTFLLTPPTSFNVTEGDTLTLPCVLPDNQPANWSLLEDNGPGFNSTEFGTVILTSTTISVISVGRGAQGRTLVCSSADGLSTATTILTVLAPLRFDTTPLNETVISEGDMLILDCVATGNPAPKIMWFINNTEVPEEMVSTTDNGTSRLTISNIQPSDSAIYQCTAMTTQESISTYTYVLVEFIREAVVSPDMILVNPIERMDFTINCTVASHPLVSIEWFDDRQVVIAPRQLPVGFRGPSVSELTLNSGDLSGQHTFNCSATLDQFVQEAMVIVNAFSPVTITTQPVDTDPVLAGFTVSFLCQAQSIPPPMITWLRNGVDPVVTDSGAISILSSNINNTTTSNLTINDIRVDDFATYTCIADNGGFFDNTSETATLTRGERASITSDPAPDTLILVEGESAMISCTARGFPLPSITWTVDPPNTITSNTINTTTISSSIEFTPSLNGTMVQCIAENIFNTDNSVPAQILFAGVPLSPPDIDVQSEARTINITWGTPFSLIDIIDYSVILLDVPNNEIVTITVNDTIATIGETYLLPFTNYTVLVIARNRAGVSLPTEMAFRTAEAAPTGSPTNVITAATRLQEVFVSWSPPPVDQQNGIIREYQITYTVIGTRVTSTLSLPGNKYNTTLTGLTPGVTYSISVSAITVATGPNTTVNQNTINNPPNIDGSPPMSSAVSTTTSFPIRIPTFSPDQAAVVWVVVIKISSSFDITQSPDTVYPNNDSFIFASEHSVIPVDSPYVAAEVSTSNDAITFPYVFQVGDEAATSGVNDNNIYSNPPLSTSTMYTAFLRVFPPAVDDGTLVKRQVSSQPPMRQYTVFTSTRFLPIIETASQQDLSSGAIAGIVIAMLIVVILAIVIVAAIIFIWKGTIGYYSHNLPPPSRKGSVRLTESQRLLNTPLPVVRHNRKSEIVTIVQNPNSSDSGPLSPLTPPDERVPILVSNFSDHVRVLHSNSDHLFAEEYELIGIKSPSLSHQASQLPWNQAKNRYANINSFDKTRVMLSEISGVDGSDYINGNYISGYKDNMYIACQGPLPETSQDFWRMVWEQHSTCIVMLTNTIEKGRTKCHQYWPSTGSISFNDLTITMVDQQTLAYYTIRTFILNMGNDRREVKQFHYTSWPDFGVPDHPNPIISFIRRVNIFNKSGDGRGPDIIHCSAGVGRTGTYITIQSMLQMIEEEGRLDVFNFVMGMRHERNLMVQTEAQYIFIHDTIVESVKLGNTEMSIQQIQKEIKILTEPPSSDDEVTPLERQFDELNSLDIPVPGNYVSAILPVNKDKNRFPDVLPYEQYKVRLLMQPGIVGSDYINASYVDGYLRRNQFILTQGPLQNTVNDFWRMIWEHRVSAIVMLCALEERGKEQSARYWPADKMTQYGDMFVETVKETDNGFYCVREMQITHTKQNNDVRNLKHFHFTEWSEDKSPDSSTSLLDMIALVQKAHHLYGGGPVVVHDSSSIGRAGTFCVMNIVIERLKVEGMVDVFFTIHSLRRKHPGIVATFDQYLFCFNTVRDYLDSFDKYSNFD